MLFVMQRVAGNRGWRFALLAILTCVLAPLTEAQWADPSSSKILRIGTSGDYAPFSEAMAASPGYRGFDIVVAEAFAKDLGYAIQWIRFTWPELSSAMRAGQFDIAVGGITVRPERSAIGQFSVPVMTSGAVLLYARAAFAGVNPNSSIEDSFGFFDRAGVRIAVNQGGHLERVTRAHFRHASIHSIANNAGVREALVDGVADAIVTDTLEAPHWRRGLAQVATFGPWTQDRKAYWIAPRRETLAWQLDVWLLAKEADGTLAQLRSAAFGDGMHALTAGPLAALLAAVDERLALMPWVAASKRHGSVAIEDGAQEQRVLDAGHRAVTAAAAQADIATPDAASVSAFYAAQIEAAKSIQRRSLTLPAQAPAAGTDLNDVLRPALQRIGTRMARLIVAVHQRRDTKIIDVESEVARALRAHQLDDHTLAQIGNALADIAKARP